MYFDRHPLGKLNQEFLRTQQLTWLIASLECKLTLKQKPTIFFEWKKGWSTSMFENKWKVWISHRCLCQCGMILYQSNQTNSKFPILKWRVMKIIFFWECCFELSKYLKFSCGQKGQNYCFSFGRSSLRLTGMFFKQ